MTDKAKLENAIRLIDTDGVREAIALLQPLADRDNADAIFILASIGTSDETADRFEARHVRMLQRAAELGQRSAVYCLYVYRDTGEQKGLLPKDEKEALRLLSQAFDLGHRDAIYQFGVMHLFGTLPVPLGQSKGRKLLEKSAELGSGLALRFLADAHEKGKYGFSLDGEKSKRYAQQAKDYSEIMYL